MSIYIFVYDDGISACPNKGSLILIADEVDLIVYDELWIHVYRKCWCSFDLMFVLLEKIEQCSDKIEQCSD